MRETVREIERKRETGRESIERRDRTKQRIYIREEERALTETTILRPVPPSRHLDT